MTKQVADSAEIPRTSWHSQDSSLREQAIGHLFMGELLAAMWRNNQRDIEVLKSEVDRGGYDLVLESKGVIRHVQLKSSFIGSKVQKVSVSTKLLAKPGGCVVWIEFDSETLKIERYLWFGGAAGSPLPDIGTRAARHSKANSTGQKTERPMHREVAKGKFTKISEIRGLLDLLFGDWESRHEMHPFRQAVRLNPRPMPA